MFFGQQADDYQSPENKPKYIHNHLLRKTERSKLHYMISKSLTFTLRMLQESHAFRSLLAFTWPSDCVGSTMCVGEAKTLCSDVLASSFEKSEEGTAGV